MFTCRPPFIFCHGIHHTTLALLAALYFFLACCPLQAASAVPFVDIVSPVSITPGSTGVIITVRGAGFVASSAVHWNGIALVTTFVNVRELTAAVPDALVAAVGLGTVTVSSPAPGGGTSNVSYIPVAAHIPVANFQATPSSSISVGTTPQGIVTGDFNGDGKIDLAVANSGDNTISILLGNGDGTFTAQTPIAVGAGPDWLVTGDFNEDGKEDLAVVNSGSNTVSILLGNGDGTFTLHSSPSTGASPFAIAAGDFNADGHLDLAVTNSADNTVTILLGNGNGTFVAGTPLAVGSLPQVLVVGDFNDDGKLDIAVANEISSSVSMLLGNGNGTFQAQTTTLTGGSGFPIGLIAADYNGDTHLDLAAVNATDVAILLGDGTGALTLNSNPAAGSFLISGVTGDYNGDGFLDLVVADQTLGQAFLLPGNGNGTFGTAVTYTTSAGTFSAVTADFNGDGALDLAFTNGGAANVSIFLQLLPVSLTPTSLAFGNQAVGTSSTAQVVTLGNRSGATLNISSITIDGANGHEFSLTTTCGATVANTGTCTISVTFSPGSVGAKVATLSVTDDAANSPQTLALSGTGTVTSQTISKVFGAASVPLNGSTSLTFTIANPSASLALTGVSFTDSLPAGLAVGNTPNVITTCTGTITAVAGASSVSLTAGTLGVSSSCTISVDVIGATAGVKNNSVTATSTQAGTGNTSNASVTVVAPPAIIKAFGAASVPLNGSTSLNFTVNNANSATALTGIAFSDSLPAGLVISTPNGITGACGGATITATQATNAISLSGATIAPSASCTFSINVTGISAGTQNNTTANITSTEGGTGGTASASLKVIAPPAIGKAFNPTGIALNATSSLTFTITNPAANTSALTGVTFSDTLPTGITLANASATVCGGTLTTTAPTGIALSGAIIAINSQCQFAVNVTGAVSGSYTNTTGNVSSTNGGTGNTTSANLSVATPPTIVKVFGAATLPLNGTASLTFTIGNPGTNAISLTGLAFTDNLPAGLVVAGTPNLNNTCGGIATATAGTSQVALSAATLAPSASCAVSLHVTGTTAGVKNNSVTITSTQAGTGNTSNASVTIVAPPILIKAFGAASVPLNGATSLSFTVNNANSATSVSGIGFSDTLPAGLVISTPNGMAGACGGGTITATQGTNAISLFGATITSSGSCTFSINVTGISAGTQNNTTGNTTSTEGGTGGTASASLKVIAPPAIVKVFSPAGIAVNATSSLTFTLTNPGANTSALTGVAFSDTLPTGITIANGSATVCGGTLTTTAPTGIVLSGANIAINSQCQFAVTVTGAVSGSYTNTTGSVSSANGGTGNTASANLSVATPPTIVKVFGATTIPLNGSTSLSFTVGNPNSSVPLAGVAFTDALPTGLVVSTPNGVAGVCGGGSIAALAAGSSISLSGAALAASASCTFSVNVTGTTPGAKINTTGAVSSAQSGAGATSNTATLTVLSPPVIAKAFGAASVAPGSSTTLTFTIQNPNASAGLTGVAVTDTLPSGLVVSTPASPSGSCGSGVITATAGATSVTLSSGIIAANGSCTFAVNVTGTSAGTKLNTTGAVTSTNGGTGNMATASLAVVAPVAPDLTITETHVGHFQQGETGAIYTITVSNAGNGSSSGAVTVTDTLPAALTATAISGGGWTCTLGSLSCTRADALAAGGSYPALTLIVNVAATAPSSVTVVATVSGGGETNTANDTASDVTIVDSSADFSITAAATTATVNKGSKAAYILTLTPLNNIPFATPITLAVSGIPADTAFQFQPASVTPGANPATSTLVLFTSTADTAIATNINSRTAPLFALGFAFGTPFAGMVLAGLRRKNGGFNLKSPGAAILLFALMGVACYGCASVAVNRNQGTLSGTYNLTVTATGGTVHHSIPLTLTVR